MSSISKDHLPLSETWGTSNVINTLCVGALESRRAFEGALFAHPEAVDVPDGAENLAIGDNADKDRWPSHKSSPTAGMKYFRRYSTRMKKQRSLGVVYIIDWPISGTVKDRFGTSFRHEGCSWAVSHRTPIEDLLLERGAWVTTQYRKRICPTMMADRVSTIL